MQGRAFGFLALLGASWVVTRIGIAMVAPSGADVFVGTPRSPTAATNFVSPAVHDRQQDPRIMANSRTGRRTSPNLVGQKILRMKATSALWPSQGDRSPDPKAGFFPQIPSARTDTVARQPALVMPYALERSGKSAKRPFDIYAYSFWRRGSAQTGTLGNGQYGGSQSALITDVPLLRFGADRNTARLALTGRLAVAHGAPRERELAAGLKWRPSIDIPVNISVERRFRQDRPDAFAVFVAGGQSQIVLPLKFRLDGYGQAGVVSGKLGGAFADMMLQARRPVGRVGPANVIVGAGAWAGGQDKVLRVDVGPSVAAVVPVAGAQFRLEASWRLRVAGNADPGNGPAVSLSTSF